MLLKANSAIQINIITDSSHSPFDLTAGQTLDLDNYDSETIGYIVDQLTTDYGASSFDVLTAADGDVIATPAHAAQAQLPFAEFIVNDTPLMNQSTTFATYVELIFVAPSDGYYRYDWHYLWSINTTTTDIRVRVKLDGNVEAEHREESKDSGGTGQNVATTTGGTANTGTDQTRQESGFCVANLTAGEHTVLIEFAGSSNNQEATIHSGHLTVTRLK